MKNAEGLFPCVPKPRSTVDDDYYHLKRKKRGKNMREPKLWVVIEKDEEVEGNDYALFPTEIEAFRFANDYTIKNCNACVVLPLYSWGEWLGCVEAAHLDEMEEDATNEPA